MYIENYLQDGANYQARAILCLLQGRLSEESKVEIGRWENCREQGYVVSVRNKKNDQLNICWYEHRNSDSVFALSWLQNTINSPTISTIPEEAFPNKWHSNFSVGYGEVLEMATWINDQITNHIVENDPK